MFCSQCGAELPDGAKFCPNCSAKVEVPVDKSLKDKVSKVAGTVTESAKSIGDKVNDAFIGQAFAPPDDVLESGNNNSQSLLVIEHKLA